MINSKRSLEGLWGAHSEATGSTLKMEGGVSEGNLPAPAINWGLGCCSSGFLQHTLPNTGADDQCPLGAEAPSVHAATPHQVLITTPVRCHHMMLEYLDLFVVHKFTSAQEPTHPSISCFHLLDPVQVMGSCDYPQRSLNDRRTTPWTGQPVHHRTKDNHSHTYI